MKKKFLSFLMVIVFMLPCMLMLSACGGNPPGDTDTEVDPKTYTKADIQRLVQRDLSSNYDSLQYTVDDITIEVVNKTINGKKYRGTIYTDQTYDFSYIQDIELIAYKDSSGKFYYAKKYIQEDSEDTDGRVELLNVQSSDLHINLLKDDNSNKFYELSDFVTYLYYKDNEFRLAYKDGTDYTYSPFSLTTIQKAWLLRDEVEKTPAYTDTDGGIYFECKPKENLTDVHFLVSNDNVQNRYRLADISYQFSASDEVKNVNLVSYLEKETGEPIEYFDGFYYYNIKTDDSNEHLDLRVYVDNNFFAIDGCCFYDGDNIDYSVNLYEFCIINIKDYSTVKATYYVNENGKYYELTDYVDLSESPSFFGVNNLKSVERTKVELTEQEYKYFTNASIYEIMDSGNGFYGSDMFEDKQEKDKIIALYGEDAYNFEFKMDATSSKNDFTAIVKTTTLLDEYYYLSVNITESATYYEIRNAIVHQTMYINFKNQKLNTISIICKIDDRFLLTNKDTSSQRYMADLTTNTELLHFELNCATTNFDAQNVADYKDAAFNDTKVYIELRNDYSGNRTITEINGENITLGAQINESDIAAPTLPEGVIFDGWYLDYNFTIPAFVNGKLDVTKSSNRMILYAKYSNLPTLTFELDGGEFEFNDLGFIYFIDYEDILNAPYKQGYRFNAFYTDAEHTLPFNMKSPIMQNTTLYAAYTKLYTIKFDVDGGVDVGNLLVVEGDDYISLPTAVEKIGYIFKGWKLKGTDTILTEAYTDEVTSDLTFVAVYEEGYVLKIHNMTYDYSSGSEERVFVLDYTITVSKTCPEGYSFAELREDIMKLCYSGKLCIDIFTDVDLTNELTGWVTGDTNLYLAQNE